MVRPCLRRLIAPRKREYLLDAKAYCSTIQYASAWWQWMAWSKAAGQLPMPAMPQQPGACVWHLIETKRMSPRSIDPYAAAVATVHYDHGRAIDRTILIEPLKAARRLAGLTATGMRTPRPRSSSRWSRAWILQTCGSAAMPFSCCSVGRSLAALPSWWTSTSCAPAPGPTAAAAF